MSAEVKSLSNNFAIESQEGAASKKALVIGTNELTQRNISNKLSRNFDFNVLTYTDLNAGLEYLIKFRASVIVIDIDKIDIDALSRVYEIISFTQTPTILLSEDSKANKEYLLTTEHSLISFLPKAVINTIFNETLEILFKDNGIATKLNQRLKKVSSRKKPKSFYLLASLLLLEPLFKTLFMKFTTGFSSEIVLRTIFSIEGVFSNFEFWFMFPLAGVALISEKSWSFLVFIGVQLYCFYSLTNYVEFSWPYVSESPHISAKFLMFVNFAVIFYFLVPENRRPYWNKSQMLWRDTSRFESHLPTYFTFGTEKIYTTITNISGSGAYFKTAEKLHIGRMTEVSFVIDGTVHTMNVCIRRTHPTELEGIYGYGVSFEGIDNEKRDIIENYIKGLDKRIQ